MRLRYPTGLLFAVLALPSAGAQQSELLRRNRQFEQLSTDDGLAHPQVYDVAQDADGYIWIATEEGLGRFDPEFDT